MSGSTFSFWVRRSVSGNGSLLLGFWSYIRRPCWATVLSASRGDLRTCSVALVVLTPPRTDDPMEHVGRRFQAMVLRRLVICSGLNIWLYIDDLFFLTVRFGVSAPRGVPENIYIEEYRPLGARHVRRVQSQRNIKAGGWRYTPVFLYYSRFSLQAPGRSRPKRGSAHPDSYGIQIHRKNKYTNIVCSRDELSYHMKSQGFVSCRQNS